MNKVRLTSFLVPFIPLVVMALIVVYVLINNSTKKESEVVEQESTGSVLWSKQWITDNDGNEYLEVKLRDETFRVPKDYVAQNRGELVFFDIIPQWPDLLPISRERNSAEYHPIRIRFRSKLGNRGRPEAVYKDSYYGLQRALASPNVCPKLEVSEQFPELLQCGEYRGGPYFQIHDETIKTPRGNPVVASCHAGGSTKETRRLSCRVSIKWSEDLSLQYDLVQYKQDYHPLEEFEAIHLAIINLIESFFTECKQ